MLSLSLEERAPELEEKEEHIGQAGREELAGMHWA